MPQRAAIEVITRVLAKGLRGRNVTVNAVSPTDFIREGKSPEAVEHLEGSDRWNG
jgi:NAD(P)-dependent dehydrogenase (short-subunit alcohol dehydrogenase family)